jgi:hypothetical protein
MSGLKFYKNCELAYCLKWREARLGYQNYSYYRI